MIRPLLILAICLSYISTFGQSCQMKLWDRSTTFENTNKYGNLELSWYNEWLEYNNGEKVLPAPLPEQPKWAHPYMKHGYTAAMHEGPRASDVSNRPGPRSTNLEVQYFHVLQKGGDFSGMCPTFAFINDSTMATLSFGRANTTLLLLDIKDTIKVLDYLPVPGRGSSAFELAGKKGRSEIFSNTAGGAYSYISNNNHIYIPGANNNILRVKVNNDRKFDPNVSSINLINQIEAGNLVDPIYSKKEAYNQLTALMPDINGNIWFTSRQGVIGLIARDELDEEGCPKIYATGIAYFGIEEKIKKHFPDKLDNYYALKPFIQTKGVSQNMRKMSREFLETEGEAHEEIQNSFSVGKDGVYIVSNYALYKFRFNEKEKKIELDPKWEENFKDGELVYDNDLQRRPGHLNAGSGTTPTLMDDRYVAICDNDEGNINLCVFRQDNGKLVSKNELFGEDGSAVENSAVAYNNSFIVANTYGYTDPFQENDTPGGIMRFDFDDKTQSFQEVEGWPKSGLIDCKTATPKLSTKTGMLYVYNRADQPVDEHRDWQVTTIDFRTGLRVVSSKLHFEKNSFRDNISMVLKKGSLGTKNYDRKVFNNIWGTFTFGPNNSFYIGTYRGFVRVSSD